ncbi:hypothetical protein PMG11_02413 [Penicillium brasilianum]|uniref:Uncharacterized protein n=1 Tax=Penicillium brasilianum TaxID=104259 RepID=A0A0F7TL67_PENBI|nr:hypothetical protein PMG11_02413 [Penicillium brasilianum]
MMKVAGPGIHIRRPATSYQIPHHIWQKAMYKSPDAILHQGRSITPFSLILKNMDTLQFRNRLDKRARRGERLSDEEIEFITNKSAELADAPTENDRVHPDQVAWAVRAHHALSKPANEINEQDASEVMSKESRAFDKLPATGSVASHVQSAGQKNTSNTGGG